MTNAFKISARTHLFIRLILLELLTISVHLNLLQLVVNVKRNPLEMNNLNVFIIEA